MKIFLSHNMSDLSKEEVMKIRENAIKELEYIYGDDIEILNNYEYNDAPKDASNLWYLGKSIQLMEEADLIYFCKESDSRGCKVEKLIVDLYKLNFNRFVYAVKKYKSLVADQRIVEAIQWNGHNLEEIKSFAGSSLIIKYTYRHTFYNGKCITEEIPEKLSISTSTKEKINIDFGDYIIKESENEFCTCELHRFERFYKLIDQ